MANYIRGITCQEIIAHASLPIGQLSEEAQE